MGKAPAFQFYVSDWMIDTRTLSLSAKGAWIDLLCAMWHSQTRGMLSLTWLGYARLLGVTVDQAKAVISELIDMRVCDYEVEEEGCNGNCNANVTVNVTQKTGQNVTQKMLHVTECNGNVTLINRRMFREYKESKNSKLRVYKHREKRKCNGKSNADVTPLSSSSSSFNKKDIYNNNEIFDPVTAFEKFFSAYPKSKFRLTAKTPAEYAFIELIKTEKQFEKLMEGLDRHKKSEQWKDDRFIPNPERFLRECRWQDVPAEDQRAKRAMCPRCKKKPGGAPYGLCPECTKQKHDEEFWEEHGGKPDENDKTGADEKIGDFTRNFGRME